MTCRSQKCCHFSSGASRMVSAVPVPALLIRMSMPSKDWPTLATASVMSDARDTSAEIPMARTPCAREIAAASRSTRGLSRARMQMSTPSAANAFATASPIPTLPPVTIACLPFSSRSMGSSFALCGPTTRPETASRHVPARVPVHHRRWITGSHQTSVGRHPGRLPAPSRRRAGSLRAAPGRSRPALSSGRSSCSWRRRRRARRWRP